MLRLTKKQYLEFIRQAVSRETGGQLDWRAVSPSDADRWFRAGATPEDVIASLNRDRPSGESARAMTPWSWLLIGTVAIAVAAVAIVFGDPE